VTADLPRILDKLENYIGNGLNGCVSNVLLVHFERDKLQSSYTQRLADKSTHKRHSTLSDTRFISAACRNEFLPRVDMYFCPARF